MKIHQLLRQDKNRSPRASNSKRQKGETKRPSSKVTVKRTTKWGNLGERVARLNDGESIVLEPAGDAAEEAQKIRIRLRNVRACTLVRRTVKVLGEKIVITRVGTRSTLSQKSLSNAVVASVIFN